MEYWDPLIRRNATLKERMFNDVPITSNTKFIHYVIFNKKSGIQSVWMPVPDLQRLLGFIQYCFLPEAYYKWIEGKDNPVVKVPIVTVENILKDAIKEKKLNSEEEKHINGDLDAIKKFWIIDENNAIKELTKFCRKFNSYWLGDSTEFLYLKVFKNAMELGDFVLSTNVQTDSESFFEETLKFTADEWLKLCYMADKDSEASKRLKKILFKDLKTIV